MLKDGKYPDFLLERSLRDLIRRMYSRLKIIAFNG
jgi:hypothetical protein